MNKFPRYFIPNDDADHSLREVDLMEWSHWVAKNHPCRVAWTGNETKYVSTVCLGLDHRWFGDGPPLVFETMVVGDGGTSIDEQRYGSWKAAEAGHKRFVKKYLIDAKTPTKTEE